MEEQQEETPSGVQKKPIAKPAEDHHVPTWLLVIIALLVGAVVAGGFTFAWERTNAQARFDQLRNQANTTITDLQNQLETAQHALMKERESKASLDDGRFSVVDAPEGKRLRMDESWDLYVNDERGFSIEIPHHVSDFGSCAPTEDAFEGDMQAVEGDEALTRKLLPTTVISPQDNGTIITTAFGYPLPAEDGEEQECTRSTESSAFVRLPVPSLTVHATDLPDDTDAHAQALDDFAAEVYGEICTAGNVSMNGDVALETAPDSDGSCQPGPYVFVYDEELNRAATYVYDEEITWRDLDDNVRLPRNLTLR